MGKTTFTRESAKINYWILTGLTGIFLFLCVKNHVLANTASSAIFFLLTIVSGYASLKMQAVVSSLNNKKDDSTTKKL